MLAARHDDDDDSWCAFRVFLLQYKAKETSQSSFFSKAGEKNPGFMTFPRALAQREMQTVSPRICIWPNNSI